MRKRLADVSRFCVFRDRQKPVVFYVLFFGSDGINHIVHECTNKFQKEKALLYGKEKSGKSRR